MAESIEKRLREAPMWRSHWPILTAEYREFDEIAGYGDAYYLDIGQSTWNKEDLSAKLWRWADNGGRWSRQSEELPLSRVLDLAILVSAAITGKQSMLHEFYQREEHKDTLQQFLTENMKVFGPQLDELRRILQPAMQPVEEVGSPNIFSFATSELSQDAMLTWLLSWADPKHQQHDSSLNAVALDFVRLLTGNSKLEVKTINAGRQWKNIDIWAKINNNVFLTIEDKTGTSIHDDQLSRYKGTVEQEYPDRIKYFAYVKTGNEAKSELQKISNAGYRIVLRKDILNCINKYSGDNVVLCNYRDHLNSLERATKSFKAKPISEWNWNAWEGFFMELEKQIKIDGWDYVANPSGGFLGAWWHFADFSEGQMYLQFEERKLCFKITLYDKIDRRRRSEIRNKCHYALMEMCAYRFPEIHKPNRFGAGEYMTIAIVNHDDFFGNTNIDIDGIITQLKKYEMLVDECCNTL